MTKFKEGDFAEYNNGDTHYLVKVKNQHSNEHFSGTVTNIFKKGSVPWQLGHESDNFVTDYFINITEKEPLNSDNLKVGDKVIITSVDREDWSGVGLEDYMIEQGWVLGAVLIVTKTNESIPDRFDAILETDNTSNWSCTCRAVKRCSNDSILNDTPIFKRGDLVTNKTGEDTVIILVHYMDSINKNKFSGTIAKTTKKSNDCIHEVGWSGSWSVSDYELCSAEIQIKLK